MTNAIEISKRAIRQMKKMAPADYKTVRLAIEELKDWPNCKKMLKLEGKEMWRKRAGDWRIIFSIHDGQPRIIRVEEVKRRNERTYN